jgi:excisionase family DNA binding protein
LVRRIAMGEERWVSVEEIAVHLGVSKETIYRWLSKDHIPAHRLGREI